MTIQEVAVQTGISAYTIRFYEKAGVLPRVKRLTNGMRQFSEADVVFTNRWRARHSDGSRVDRILADPRDPYRIGGDRTRSVKSVHGRGAAPAHAQV